MASRKFKYNINHQISLLPREVAISDIIDILHKEGISQDSFYRDRNITLGSDQSIPSDRLFIYADLFECSVSDLLAANRKPVDSIRVRLLKKSSPVKVKNYLS